jgi:hypothetical protein
MNRDLVQHSQQTLLSLGDEFLIQYFLCAHAEFRRNQILSRLFSMGHSLELYAKAALVSAAGTPPHGHDIPNLIKAHDPSLLLSQDEITAGEALFRPDVTKVDLGLWLKHEEALELYLAEYYVKDLKYYITRKGETLCPAIKSLRPVNMRYLQLVRSLRQSIKYKEPSQDQMLVELIDHLGFETNPALFVVETN